MPLRQTDIVAYRGVICNQKGYPRVHWILGRLQSKNQGPKSRNKKDMSFQEIMTDQQHEGSQGSYTSKKDRYIDRSNNIQE